MAFFTEFEQKKLYNLYRNKRFQIAKIIMKKKSGTVGIRLLNFKCHLQMPHLNSGKYFLPSHQMMNRQSLVCVCFFCFVLFCFLSVVCESKSLFPGVWQQKDWLAVSDRGLYNKRVLLGITLPKDKISRLQGVMRKYFIFRKHTVKTLLYQSKIIYVEAIRSLQYWSISSIISCGSKEAGAKCIGCSGTMSEGKSS